MTRLRKATSVLGVCAALSLLTTTDVARAAEQAGGLAERLAQLRADVEGLSEQLRLTTTDRRERRSAAAARRAELEAERRREALRVSRLTTERDRLQQEVKEAAAREQALLPLVERTLDRLDAQIATGLPFRVPERRAEVQGLRDQLAASTLSPRQALLRAWSLFQDEIKLTQESALHRQTLTVEDEELLADVVRLGMTTIFFSAPDGRVGRIERGADGWRTVVLTDEAQREAIAALFDAHKKQLRTGYFPMPLPPLQLVDASAGQEVAP
jgi:hypothetical protein